MMTIHGSAPVGVLQVVAKTLYGPVPLDVALGSHQERRAELLHGALGCIDQRKSIGNGILGQLVLLCQVSSSFVDHCPEISHVMAGELSFDGRKTNAFPGGGKGFVDGGVGDAGVLVGWTEGGSSSRTGNDQSTAGLRRRRSRMMRRRRTAAETVETMATHGQ